MLEFEAREQSWSGLGVRVRVMVRVRVSVRVEDAVVRNAVGRKVRNRDSSSSGFKILTTFLCRYNNLSIN